MSSPFHIRRLSRPAIDVDRWDRCIAEAQNSLIYGYHYYLDHMAAGQWDALVFDDYKAVMPLPWRRKYGITYLYQPAFTQQTGIFSAQQCHIEAFLTAVTKNYRFAEIFLNYANNLPTLKQHTNYILPLNAPYKQIAAGYKKDLVKNLKQTRALHYHHDSPPTLALETFRQQFAHRITSLKKEDFERFERLCGYLRERGQLLVRTVTDHEQTLLATALLLKDSKRLYLLHLTTLPTGRDMEAGHFLLDELIKEYAGNPLILDFEGSDIPGIAHFYANFGSQDQPYFFFRHNRLPWPLSWLKR
jgi:ribosomal protein S18 acetylase RimI-like enzyme